MSKGRILALACVILCWSACGALDAAEDPFASADRKVAEITKIARPVEWHWRYKIGDVPNAWDVALDDSSWLKRDGDNWQWGDQPLVWLRTTFTVPEKVFGVPIAGTKITLKCGIDDDGVLYVDGKQIRSFHWDQCASVLTEKAVPGQTFSVVIKGINTGGPGGLQAMNVEYAALDDVNREVYQFLDWYRSARDIYASADSAKRAPYAPVIEQAVEQVNLNTIESADKDGFIASLKSSETQLQKATELAADITVHLVGHAHIDLAYLWEWPETVGVCRNTFSTMCKMMDEYPEFIFSQSQPALYAEMKQSAPDVFARIKEMVKRGQWDVSTAATWCEGDTNMSGGEATVRSILYGKRFIMKEFGIEPTVCWEPDNFGHSWAMPQILAKSGINYYYCARRGPGFPLFWWEGPDGSRVLAFSHGHYNLGVEKTELARSAVDFVNKSGVRDYMRVHGVGDHGGGPTKAQINTAREMQSMPSYPKVKHDTASGYFNTVAGLGAKFPVYSSEMNPMAEGCYTVHSDAKKMNRDCENKIADAEVFSTIAMDFGTPYPAQDFEQAWRNTCFNEFHDILCGSAVHAAFDYAKQLHDEAVSKAGQALDASLSALASRISTQGLGTPVVVFNPLSWSRTDAVTAAYSGAGQGGLCVVDADGRAYPASLIGGKLSFTARDVPPMGYKVFWVRPGEQAGGVSASADAIENQFFRVRIDSKFGVISSIYDKVNNREVIADGGSAALLRVLLENSRGLSAWGIGRSEGEKDIVGRTDVATANAGFVKATAALAHKYMKSSIQQDVTLYDGVPRIDVLMKADWQELWNADAPTPMLKVAFATSLKNAKATFEIPYGSIERKADGSEVVAQKWIDLSQPDYGVSLLNDCKYGFDVRDNVMRMSLLRSPHHPDPAPDQGMHEINYSLYPHKGDWRAAGTVRRGCELNQPLIARVVEAHSGSLPASRSFVSVAEPNVVITALKRAEDDDSYILRFYESFGRRGRATIKLSMPVKSVVETDLMERPTGKKMQIKNGAFSVNVGKWEIKTYKLLPK